MAWVRIHDAAMTHPKIVGLSDKAFRLWVWGLSYAQQHLTDGLLVEAALPRRLARAHTDLLRMRLWERHEVGFKIHDYLDWNDSREVVLSKRQSAKDRLDEHRMKRVSNALQSGENKRVSDHTTATPLARSGVGISTTSSEKERTVETDVGDRAGRLLQELYPAWYAEFRHGARLRLVANSLAYHDAVTVCQTWDDARIEKLARIFLTTDEEWISRTDRSFRLFCSKATWCDDRLAQFERQRPA